MNSRADGSDVGKKLPRPRAILCISAHWETWGRKVTAMTHPRTIHDFGGFPQDLYEVEYQAPGSAWLAAEARNTIKSTSVSLDEDWGLDHGCWSVMKQMFPAADVPIVQLSLDSTRPARDHYEIARELAPLRDMGVLIIGSGNIVHNLRRIIVTGNWLDDLNRPFGLDWAIEASERITSLIRKNNFDALIEYQALGKAVQLAVPTPEHYLPMLYAIALKQDDESVAFFNDKPIAGSLTMTSLLIDRDHA